MKFLSPFYRLKKLRHREINSSKITGLVNASSEVWIQEVWAPESGPLTYSAPFSLDKNLQRSLLRICEQLFNEGGGELCLLLPMWFIWLYSKTFPHADRTPCKYYTKFSCTEGICDGYLDWHVKYPKQNSPRLEDFLFHELETWKDCQGIRSIISPHL